jgi:mannose-6-phosphate isomerase
MELLDAPIRRYAWGSHTTLAAMQGRPAPTSEPEAELWLGAHPGAPAVLAGSGRSLDQAIAADPEALLGPGIAAAYGPRLPFLLKVLAAAQPLSLQAHPDSAQAAAGFAAEEAAGVPRDAPHRTYTDAAHKPELLVAVEPFDALCGFRAPGISADALAGLDVAALLPAVAALRRPAVCDALRAGVSAVLALDPAAVAEAASAAAARSGYELVVELAERYPGDPGVVLALLLNRMTLRPGEAAWMPAGNLHAYLRGTGVEIMAASDNVLRGGLTPKHVNVPELLRVLRFEVLADPVVRAVEIAPGVVTWPVPVDDFALYRAVLESGDGPVELPGDGPRVVLCLRGSVTVDDGLAPVALVGGSAAFARAGAKPLLVTGAGEVYQAGCRP